MKILVIDDDESVCQLLRDYLEHEGHETESAVDAKSALALLEINTYDWVFTDQNMPDMTGLEIVRSLRESGKDVRILMMTGYSSMEDFFVKQLGVDEFMEKPVQLTALSRMLEKYEKRGKS